LFFSDWNISEDSFNFVKARDNMVNVLKNQVWYYADGYCDTLEDFGYIVERALRYIQYVSNWSSNNAFGTEVMAQIKFELTKFLGYMSAGCGDTVETEVLTMDEIEENETYVVTKERALLIESGLDIGVAHGLKGKKVTVKAKNEETVVIVCDKTETTVPISILREPADKKKAGKVKYVWFDEFVKLLEPFQNDPSPSIRRDALVQLTTYRSKQSWADVDNSTAIRIRVNEPKKKNQRQRYARTHGSQ